MRTGGLTGVHNPEGIDERQYSELDAKEGRNVPKVENLKWLGYRSLNNADSLIKEQGLLRRLVIQDDMTQESRVGCSGGVTGCVGYRMLGQTNRGRN
jgi:hypothetical protein